MKTETFLRILAGLLCAGNTGAENPLEFREYTQTVRLEFLSPREAASTASGKSPAEKLQTRSVRPLGRFRLGTPSDFGTHEKVRIERDVLPE